MKLKLAVLFPLIATGFAELKVKSNDQLNSSRETPCTKDHGPEFSPDEVLRVTLNDTFAIGCQTRASVLVNGTAPGPPIRLEPGKTTWVRVYNDMDTYNFTMHWHGLSQRVAPFADGTPTASQWPIAPHHYFDYEVHPEPEDAGTYFYHSHVGFQAVSAHGALTVVDADTCPYQYDEERTMLLTDYFNKTDAEIEKGLVSQPFVWSGEPNAVLLNGIGVSVGEEAGTDACQMPVVSVEPGKRYRFRFIGGTAISMVQIAFEGHDTLEVIAADGQYTKPYRTSYLQVSPGQRFDAILQTKSAAELTNQTDFVIQYETRARPSVLRSYGILRYLNTPSRNSSLITKGPSTPPLELPENAYDFLEYALEPLAPNDFPTAEEVTRRITITARQLAAGSTIWQLNGLQWNETTPTAISSDDRPYLVALYEDGPAAMPNYTAAMENSGWDPETFAFPAKLGEVLEIIWENTGSLVKQGGGVDYHPFHAHGKHYYDCGSGNGTYDPVANEAKLKDYNPVLRDTTNLYRYETTTTAGTNAGWRAWRLRVEDAGVWMVHCHILQHMIMGMQSVWVFGDYDDIVTIPHPTAIGYLEYGGASYGNSSFVPSYVHSFSD